MKNITMVVALASLVAFASSAIAASPPVVLVRDNFNAATPNTTDLNVDIARQTGTLAPLNYTMASGPGHYGHQLQNANAVDQLLVADFPNSTSSPDQNFDGANSAGGLIISFDLDSMPAVYGSTPDNWGCVNLGMSQANQLANVNQGVPHFGILFRAAGTLQAFDGSAVVSPATEPVYSLRPPGTTNHIDLVITDADGNPFDGTGNTIIEVFVNGGALPVWTYTKVGGYADNYINVQGSFRAHFDNLTIAQLPSNRAPEIVNPSFEANTFTVAPGYVSGNGPITGWTALGGHGVNPGTFGGPFTDNGAIPDGTRAAFLQEDGAMTQVVSGFSIGATYQIRYFENARNGGTPGSEVRIGGSPIVASHVVSPVGGSNPYREMISDPFVATGTAMELAFIKSNPQGGDTTLLIDSVSVIAPNTPPNITLQPQDAVLVLGETTTFTVGAAGSAPLSYEWYFNGDLVLSADRASLTVQADFPDTAGNYVAVVSNASGSVTSRVARLILRDLVPGVFNTGVDDTGAALADGAVDSHYRLIVNPDAATPDAFVENSAAFPIAPNGPWVANNSGSKWIGPRFDTTGAAGAVGAGGDYVYRTAIDLAGFDPATVAITGLWSTDNDGVDIIVNGRSTGQRNSAQFASFTPFTINSGLVAGPNTIDFKVNNSAVGYTGLRVDQFRALGDALPPGTAPFILAQPQSASLAVGQTATFAVQANGSAPLAYQWFFGPDPLPGENKPALSVFIEFEDVAGGYSVEITNPVGSIRSSAATLTVLAEPVILTQPQSRTVAVGDSVTFNVSAIGEPPLTYRWTRNGQAIPGAEETNYTIASVTAADAGAYAVEVSNFSGSITSAPAVLSIAELVPGLFNTGVDGSGVSLPSGSIDPHWTMTASADPAFPGPDAFVLNDVGFPIPPWLPNDETSKWIAPRADQSAGNLEGDYTYQTTFDLTGFNPATTSVTGEWATDNTGIDILINGTATGQPNIGSFVVWTPFSINSGFQAGVNTLTFRMNNAPSGINPTGFRVRNLRAIGGRAGNQAPSFTKGPDVSVPPDAGPQTVSNWASNIQAGPPNESSQTLMFIVSTENSAFFTVLPAIDPVSGTLTFTPAPGAVGAANCSAVLMDNGGTDNGGVDKSAPQSFRITVMPRNQPPTARIVATPTSDFAPYLTNDVLISCNYSNASIRLNGLLSSDPETPNSGLTFHWFLEPMSLPFAEGVAVSNRLELGTQTLRLDVTDPQGATGSESLTLEVITVKEAIDVSIQRVEAYDGLSEADKRKFIEILKVAGVSADRDHVEGEPHGQLTILLLDLFQYKVQKDLFPIDPVEAECWILWTDDIIEAERLCVEECELNGGVH